MTRKKHRPYPDDLIVTRVAAGTEDEFYGVNEILQEAADSIEADEAEQRIAVYRLVKVLLPEAETTFTEVENDNGG